ncbi:hypothetical protein OG401_40815 [Kitasatospora purpeofusca]|uniref:hypothetical protein n=1 Tax=Kitasatospora purpeofusca TaxID=67352 RepID=UPI0022579820|nr:hypothetical protein [Kitasatospora purpeofusca]MCX4690566.1 hypothetical protein [Kitasatospora purpeofusca]
MIGTSHPRTEDHRLLTGRGRFTDDLDPTAYSCAVVRSPHAAAEIDVVDCDRARAHPGVVAAVSYQDLPPSMRRRLPLLIPHHDLTHPRTGHVLAHRKISSPVRRS